MNRPETPHRRHFLKASGIVAASAAISSSGVAADEPKRFKKAVKIDMVGIDGSLTDKFKLLKELGFDGVELNSPGGPTAAEVEAALQRGKLATAQAAELLPLWQACYSSLLTKQL